MIRIIIKFTIWRLRLSFMCLYKRIWATGAQANSVSLVFCLLFIEEVTKIHRDMKLLLLFLNLGSSLPPTPHISLLLSKQYLTALLTVRFE